MANGMIKQVAATMVEMPVVVMMTTAAVVPEEVADTGGGDSRGSCGNEGVR